VSRFVAAENQTPSASPVNPGLYAYFTWWITRARGAF